MNSCIVTGKRAPGLLGALEGYSRSGIVRNAVATIIQTRAPRWAIIRGRDQADGGGR